MKIYKHLLFDLDDTLLDYKKTEHNAIEFVFNLYNIDSSNIELFSQINNDLWKKLEKGLVERQKLKIRRFEILFEELNINRVDPVIIAGVYEDYISQITIPFEKAEPVLKKLHEKEYVISLITNGSLNVQSRRLEGASFNGYISNTFVSEMIGYNKPNPSYFDYVINTLGAKREECLIIGDSLTSDILGGINSHIDTCLVDYNQNKNTNEITPTYTINDLNDIFGILGEVK